MITGCVVSKKRVLFFNQSASVNKNIYTTIVGRNGSGKSRLLRGLINSFIPRENYEGVAQDILTVHNSFFEGAPKKIIAVSTSPFDKFPYEKYYSSEHYNGARAGYSYLGLKGIPNENSGLGYLSRIIGSLMKNMSSDPSNAYSVASTLDYLGYTQEIEAKFSLLPKLNAVNKILSSSDPMNAIDELFESGIGYRFTKSFKNKRVKKAVLGVIWKSMAEYVSQHDSSSVRVLLSSEGVKGAGTGESLGSYFDYLHEVGLIRLEDVVLKKNGKRFSIKDASSGEQCVVMTMLGIASQIEDGSLICIDEPEVCLHPEWQERYIELLMSMFSRFERCHFLIATHSPQIVAKLGGDNCYVLDLESNTLLDAKDMNKRSADFQLAKVFHAPGYKNEYLSRELLSALATLGSGGILDSRRLNALNEVISLKSKLEHDDPVLQLVLLVEGALVRAQGN